MVYSKNQMGEIKSVKVDNWGVFFLQKLQNFFNKTDYCDLTLQFNDNSQLKVHRLVLSACTDYFNILERTTDCIDQILIMPIDFQADVVVPIVNFMYTGTLEFEYKMYDRLFRTAKHMNMTVLVKLLEAHRKSAPRIQPPPVLLNRGYVARPKTAPLTQALSTAVRTNNTKPSRVYSSSGISSTTTGRVMTRGGRQPQMSRPMPVTQIKTEPQTETVPFQSISHLVQNKPLPETISIVSKYRSDSRVVTAGPSRFESTEETPPIPDELDTFNTISYESQPLMKAIKEDEFDEYEELEYGAQSISSSTQNTFEQLRKGYTNVNKRPASQSSFTSPPTKKPNLQDVKEYTEAARLRKQLEEQEGEDDPNYVYDDDTHFNDDDDDDVQTNATSKVTKSVISEAEIQADENQIIVKDNSGNVDHAKIISEVLKKYPHLVKNNKNIKLKIMQKSFQEDTPNATPVPQPIKMKSSPAGNVIIKSEKNISPIKHSPPVASRIKTEKPDNIQYRPTAQQPQTVSKQSLQQQKQQPQQIAPKSTPNQPKKIDSKTMHALIAKGAENMTGPWLCLRCGIGGRPISIPSYKSFRRHLINIHKEKIDPRICEHCGWKAFKKQELIEHYQVEHNIKIKVETAGVAKSQIPQPVSQNKLVTRPTKVVAAPATTIASTSKKDIQHCIYCNKVFSKESLLYTHMKTAHKEKARQDGVIDFSDDDHEFDEHDKYIPNDPSGGEKIKILSDIKLPSSSKGAAHTFIPGTQIVSLEPSSEAEALSNVASGIATSLALVDNSVVLDDNHFHTGQYIQEHGFIAKNDDLMGDGSAMVTKLVTADGAELELTQSQKDEIISQLQSQGAGDLGDTNVVMVLNEEHFDGSQIINTDSQNIVVVYSQADENAIKAATEALIESTAPMTSSSTKVVDAIVTDTTPTMDWQDVEAQIKNTPMELSNQLKMDESVTNLSEIQNKDKSSDDKMKLISALEGDWSDDEEEQPIVAPPRDLSPAEKSVPTTSESKVDSEDILFVVSTGDENVEHAHHETEDSNMEIEQSSTNTGTREEENHDTDSSDLKTDKNEKSITETAQNISTNDKESELNNILGDWLGGTDDEENKSQSEVKDGNDDETTINQPEDETQLETSEPNLSMPSELGEEEHQENEEETGDQISVTSAVNTSAPEENAELKTLINDWDDDDDGEL